MSSYAIRAVRALSEYVDEYLNDAAILSIRVESTKVMTTFGADIPTDYQAEFNAAFLQMGPLRHPHFLYHETEQDLQTHYTNHFKRPGMFPAWGVRAFCTPVYRDYPDADKLMSLQAPANRVIEFPQGFVTDSVAHELLHWVTHQTYEDNSTAYTAFANKVIIEGVTEYFSRFLYPGRTSYQDELKVVQRAITEQRVAEGELRSAYFGGQRVSAVLQALGAAAAEALAADAAEQRLAGMVWWRSQLARYKKDTDLKRFSRGLLEFLENLSDTEIDRLANGSGVTPDLVKKVKEWVAEKRKTLQR